MREFVIMTDSDTEIPYWFADENQLEVFLMPYTLDGKEFLFDLGRNTDYKTFYARLREGAQASTATRSPVEIEEFYENILKQGKDILYICFSSKLSAHYELSLLAREEVLKRYPQARITVIDSASISMGAGMLVYHAVRLKKEGKNMDEIAAWLEENKTRSLHFFTVDSLQHLKRTGRLSTTKATLGTILDLKPVLMLNKEGKIIAYDKVKGRKRVVSYLVGKIEENLEDDEVSKDLCVVVHGDNLETAQAIEKQIKERFDFKHVWLEDVGPVIGIHAGPGVVAVLFMGKERTE